MRAAFSGQATGTFAVKLVAMGLTVGTQVLLARMLGTEAYGLYFYAITCLNFLTLPGKLGLDAATLRFLPAYRSQHEWPLLRGFFARTTRLALASSLAMGVLVVTAVLTASERLRPGLPAVLLVAAATLPLGVLLQLYGARLQGLKRAAMAESVEEVGRRAFFVAALLVVVSAMGMRATAPLAMALNLASIACALVIVLVLLRNALPPASRAGVAEYRTDEWMRVGFSLCGVAGFHLVLNQADILLVGALVGTTEAGIYGVASRLAALLVFGLAAVNAIAAPMISELWTEGRKRELQTMVTWAARGASLVCVPLAVVMLVWRREILGVFGAGFAAGEHVLVILVVGQVVNALAGSVASLLTMTGHQMVVVRVLGVNALLNVLLNLLLIPMWGIAGAAVATATTTVVWNGILCYFVWRRLGMRATAI